MNYPSRLARLSCAAAFALAAGFVQAQDFPNRPVKLVVTYAPGVVTDIVARLIAPEMSKSLGQPVVVENRPGADTVIGFDHVATKVPADGYTMVVTLVPGLATLPLSAPDLRFDPIKDLPPLIDLTESRLVFGSSNKFAWKTLDEMLGAAKSNPGKLNAGTSSSLTKLLVTAFARDFGINVVQVPFTGGGPWNLALAQGTVEMGFIAEGAAISASDKLNVLAVTGDERSKNFSQAPTFKELGRPNYTGLVISLNARAGTPKAALDKLYAAASQAMANPELRTRLQGAGFEPISGSTPDSAAKRLTGQAEFFAQTAKQSSGAAAR